MEASDIERIKASLDAVHDWPGLYMFKFIVPSDNEKIAKVESLFDSTTAEIRMNASKNGKFTSITVKEIMVDADSVLDCYKQAADIEGLIAL